jgi:pimeloyl-ACP methyl ester carboxylesterase
VLERIWAPPAEGQAFVEGLEVLTRLPAEPNGHPPLLFVHGASHGAWSWDEHWMPAAAARGWTCHAVSLSGHGASRGGGRLRRIRDYVQDVRQVIVRLPQPPVLIGHSMGALVIARILATYRPPAAVMVAAIGLRHGLGFGWRLVRLHPLHYLRGLLLVPPAPTADYLFAELDPDEGRRLADRTVPESVAVLYELHGPRRTPRSPVPVLVLGGGRDAVIPALDTVRNARHYGTRAHLFRGMGHDLMLDRRWREPLDLMLDWLEDTLSAA